jgi:hypothetical protein
MLITNWKQELLDFLLLVGTSWILALHFSSCLRKTQQWCKVKAFPGFPPFFFGQPLYNFLAMFTFQVSTHMINILVENLVDLLKMDNVTNMSPCLEHLRHLD